MAKAKILKSPDRQSEKELTLEMPLEELWDVQEIWRDVSAFHQVLERLSEGQTDVYDPLLRLFNPIYGRFGELMSGKLDLDQRICDATA